MAGMNASEPADLAAVRAAKIALAHHRGEQGRGDAIPILERLIASASDDEERMTLDRAVALTLERGGQTRAASDAYGELAQSATAAYGADEDRTLSLLRDLARTLRTSGEE